MRRRRGDREEAARRLKVYCQRCGAFIEVVFGPFLKVVAVCGGCAGGAGR